MSDLTGITAAVAAEQTVDASVLVLVQSLADRLTAANGDQAAIDALTADLQAEAASLAAAVTTNTVAHTGAIPGQVVQPGVVPGVAGSSFDADLAAAQLAGDPAPAAGPVTVATDPDHELAEPVEVSHPDGFRVKVVGETYHDYVTRAEAAGMTSALDLDEWTALTPDPVE